MYFLNKTNCALQWAIQNEANFGGKLICPEKVFLFDGNELDMFTETKYMSDGWELVDSQNSEKVSFIKIWHGQCPHISVCFRRSTQQTPRTTSLAIEMSLHVFTFQRTLEENGEKMFIQVFEDEKTPFTQNEIRCNHQIEIQINNYNDNSCETTKLKTSHDNMVAERPLASTGGELPTRLAESSLNCDKTNNADNLKFVINNKFSACSKTEHYSRVLTDGAEPRLFPHYLRQRLVLLLDPPKGPYGQDWKDLASKLGLDACIPKLQTQMHPTAELLNVLENQGKSYTDVIALFNDIGRMDCVEEMKKYFETGVTHAHLSSREPIENTCNGYERGESHLRSEESPWTGSSRHIWPSQFSSRKSINETYSKDISDSHN
ncbi:uncharacterized protein LOC123539644 [Mercenaria mercenaria]|uniref:uncharacterized protein LOC123539644 n=1 Tax=Mercenaria mercenaria TaxID=6596 RepID=UPI00234F84E0|nr:uncharacterized protein LOC123539644 [Mercenaria mercenaria]